MALLETPYLRNGWHAQDFSLQGTDGLTYRLEQVKGEKGTVIMFICNHCPFVLAIAERLASTAVALQDLGVGTVAIMSNDTQRYPADNFANMKLFKEKYQFPFAYCIDEDQRVARAYEAVCTPDIFGFDGQLKLRYRGRLDSAGKQPVNDATEPELVNAMRDIASIGKFEGSQFPSIGCSIKWK